MPKPKYTPPSELYQQLLKDSKSLNEKYDCAVIAVSAVTGVPYKKVHPLFTKHGRN